MKAKKSSNSQKRPEWDDSEAVDAFMAKLKHPLKAELEAVRNIILNAAPGITEGIKWNAPSFYRQEWFATTNVRGKDKILIVFHQGAKVKDNTSSLKIDNQTGLLQWLAKDRCIASFSSAADVRSKKAALESVVSQWVKQMPPRS